MGVTGSRVGRIMLLAAAAAFSLWLLRGGVQAAQADPARAQGKDAGKIEGKADGGAPANPNASHASGASPAPAARDPRVAEIDTQIKALRDQFTSQLNPLEEQIKALREKFDPQIKALQDQRREIVESGKSPEMRALDDQEQADLKSLADQEKAEIDKVRQHYDQMRKDIQAKYQARRKELNEKK